MTDGRKYVNKCKTIPAVKARLAIMKIYKKFPHFHFLHVPYNYDRYIVMHFFKNLLTASKECGKGKTKENQSYSI